MNKILTRLDQPPSVEVAGEPLSAEFVYRYYSSATALFDVLMTASRQFDGDYVSWAIYCAFLVSSAADSLRDVTLKRHAPALAPGVLSALSAAEMTGIPRETVRRKCLLMAERGLLVRTGRNQFRCDIDPELARSIVQRIGREFP